MPEISHNISNKIDLLTLGVLDTVDRAATALEIPYFLAGAKARDILLHHLHGANIQRATEDYDFAIDIADWPSFEKFKAKLIEDGFEADRQAQRVVKGVVKIDLIPFGPIARGRGQVDWPPDGDFTMNVVGFEEALKWREYLRIRNEPPLDVPIVTTTGLTLLKLIAWMDRSADKRRKDALDLRYIFSNYEADPKVLDLIYQDQMTLEYYGWDPTLSGVHRLGKEVRKIAGEASTKRIHALAQGQLKGIDLSRLIEEMCSRSNDNVEYQNNEHLLQAFFNGYNAGV